MRKLACLLLFFSTLLGTQAGEPTIHPGSVVVIPLKDEVSEAQFFFLRRVLKKAEAQHASAFIIDMDTYGGSLKAAVNMLDALMKSTVPTITYVDSNAGSAGALIALSTKRIYMAPVSAIGAAAPVTGEGQDLQETMNAKVVSYFSGYFRSAAESNGYNPLLAEAFINKEKEFKIGDTVLNPKGSLLTLSAQEAAKDYNGKPLLALAVVPSLDELCQKAGLDPKAIVRIEPSGFEYLSQWITGLAPIFLMAGIVFAYLEFKTPGFGVAGILSGACFLIFFTGHYIAGLTGFEVAAVFFLGVILLVVELIFFPGFLIVATIGLGLMLGSLLFAMTDLYPDRPISLFTVDTFLGPALNLAVAIVFSGILIALLARYFPSLPFFNRLILAQSGPASASLPEASSGVEPLQVGETGTARSILRPSGKADFSGRLVDVVTEGEFVDAGTPIRITLVAGERVVVAPLSHIPLMAYYLYKLLPPRPTFLRDMTGPESELMRKHAMYLHSLREKGVALAFGPVDDEHGSYGIALLHLPEGTAIQDIAEADPVLKAQAGFSYEAHPMPILTTRGQ